MMILGLDWSRYKHDFALMDSEGNVVQRGTIAHNPARPLCARPQSKTRFSAFAVTAATTNSYIEERRIFVKNSTMFEVSSTEALEELAATIQHQVNSVEEVRLGLELNDGALLAWLLSKGYRVLGIQPKSAQRARDVYRPSGSKDDGIDAFVPAEFVRVNLNRLRPWRPDSESYGTG